ncbi:hypothetical protein [Aliiruegeria sabulilitoris]|uniref:hypothetical protein n=1 Tax=Aliiruegeria sabulilitoris TaxID=1510458 RepID=UPI00082CAD7C|nr:hypothetical protein [Aliiruegeria sabulilitoris]NDR59140.1 hypothetical protein [Pseudoruegeria sp. M32A2M]
MFTHSSAIPRVPRRSPSPSPTAQSTPPQRELSCSACGNQCRFDPAQEALICDGCGNAQAIEAADQFRAAQEYPFDPNSPETEPRGVPPAQEHQCNGCGGTVLFSGTALSERCPYCNGPMVLVPGRSGYDAMALIPFRITVEDARNRALNWISTREGAPNRLTEHVAKSARSAGLYAPFWTFDTSEALTYMATWMEYEHKRMVTRSTTGHHAVAFDDLLVPASPHVTPLIRDGILHEFDPGALGSFDARYLAGFAAERHHQSVAEGFAFNAPDKQFRTKRKVGEDRAFGENVSLAVRTDDIAARYRRILLPVWIFHYDHSGRPYKVVVSGINGQTFGERPYSTAKLALASGLVSFLVVSVGIVLGMMLA